MVQFYNPQTRFENQSTFVCTTLSVLAMYRLGMSRLNGSNFVCVGNDGRSLCSEMNYVIDVENA